LPLLEELKRRNVFRVAIAYAVTSWLLLQLGDIVVDAIGAPEWVMKTLLAVILIGFPVALLFAWAFEVTPEGIKKESDVDRSQSITQVTRRKLDTAIIVVLALALSYFAYDKFLAGPGAEPEGTTLTQTAPAANAAQATQPATAAAPAAGNAALPDNSIAVLPFVNLSSDPEQEFFSDGISEELLNVLAQFPGLRVAARTSSFQFKGQNQDIGEIARLLKVKHVLEGSVRKAGNRLRITAQLIEAENGYNLWSETYDRELNDVFAIQDEISAAISEALRIELALGPGTNAAGLPRVAESENTAAYEAFLKGRHLINQRGRRNITEGVGELERAVRLDPQYAPAHAWLAIGIALLLNSPTSYGEYPLSQMLELATPHLEEAMRLDPRLAEAHGARGLVELGSGNFQAVIEATTRALDINPIYVDAMNWRNIALQSFGDWQGAIEQMRKVVEVDPLSVIGRLNFISFLAQTEPAASEAMARELAEQSPWAGYVGMSRVYAFAHQDFSESLYWALKAYKESPLDDLSNRGLIYLFAFVGEYEEARRISDLSAYLVDMIAGNVESARADLEKRAIADPENPEAQLRLANAYHLTGRIEDAQRLYLMARDKAPSGVILGGDDGTMSHARLVWGLRQTGQSALATEAAADMREDIRKLAQAGIESDWDLAALAMVSNAEGDEATALELLRRSFERGLRDLRVFDEPAMASLAANPEALSIRAEIKQELDREHAEMLQLICFRNPIPETWQPLRQTCTGVIKNT
jgi:TolB-like protein/Tfp pilus assembly protein PilF